MAHAVSKAVHVAQFDHVIVVLIGETGVGKSYFADLIHRRSPRAQAPFVQLDACGLDDGVAGSELFGHAKGSFTGASERREGRILGAHTGSLFLDELSHASLAFQAKLLVMLDRKEILGVGMNRRIPIDVRLIVGTNVPLDDLIASGNLLKDLLYRLGLCHVVIPPLRERRADIPELAEQFVRLLAPKYGYRDGRRPKVHMDLVHFFQMAMWGGNVRQFAMVIDRLLLEARGALVLTPALCVEELAFLVEGLRGGARELLRQRVRDEYRDRKKISELIALTGKSRSTIHEWVKDLRAELEASRRSGEHPQTGDAPPPMP